MTYRETFVGDGFSTGDVIGVGGGDVPDVLSGTLAGWNVSDVLGGALAGRDGFGDDGDGLGSGDDWDGAVACGDGVVADGDELADLDADLELDLDAREKLDLEVANLLLDVRWDAGEVEPVVGTLETLGLVLVHQVGDLVVEVADLAFADDDELEVDADVLLVLVLLLALGGLVLALGELVLEGLLLGGSQVDLLELVGQVSGSDEVVLEFVEDLGTEGQV